MARKIRQQVCGNCEHRFELDEHFCPKCGQDNHSPNQPIRHYLSELVETLLHLDSKFFSTVGTMLRHPGKTTLEFNENKRARYMPPIRLYIFVSLVFFILVQSPSLHDSKESDSPNAIPTSFTNRETGNPDRDSLAPKSPDPKTDTAISLNVSNIEWSFTKFDVEHFRNGSDSQIDSLIVARGSTPNYFKRKLVRQILKSTDADSDFVERIREKIIHFFSGALFILMPVFAWQLSLLYWRRKKYYYEYLIFAIHFHTVSFILLSLILFVDVFISVPSFVFLFGVLGLIFYLYKALRYNYQQSRSKTLWKTGILCFSYGFTLLFAAVIVILLGWFFV